MRLFTDSPMRQHVILLVILLLAALFRLYNINYALPEIYEEATPMRQAWEMWHWEGDGFDLNPRFFHYPALFFYLQFLAQIIYFGINRILGRFEWAQAMHLAFEADPTEIMLLARLLTVAFGLGAVWGTYRLGRACANHPTGLIAAAVIALAQIPIATSRTILVDVPLVFFGALALTETAHPNQNFKRALRTGLWIGLAASSKYTGALFIIPFTTAHLLTHRTRHLPQWLCGLGIFLGAFLLTSPYCLLDFQAFWADFSYERTHMVTGHFGTDAALTQRAYAHDLWQSLGIGLILALPIGLWQVLKQRISSPNRALPLLIFAIAYFGIISTWAVHRPHYLLPLFPPLAVIAAIGINQIATRIHISQRAYAALVILVLLPTAMQSGHDLAQANRPDARTAAKRWIEAHIPPDALIVAEFYTPEFPRATYDIIRLSMDILHPETMAVFYNLDWYTDFDYIITSESIAQRYSSEPERFATQIKFYTELRSKWIREASFAGESFSGPGIDIYRRPTPRPAMPQPYPETQYDVLIGSNPTSAQGLLGQLARLFQERGWCDKAIDVYYHLAAMTSNNANIYAELGLVLYESGRLPEAEEVFSRALQGDLARANYVRGTLYFLRGQPDSAAAAWERDLLTNGADLGLRANLGAIYYQQGDTARAIQIWERGLQQNPADPHLINNLLYVYQTQQKTDLAVQLLQKALAVQPNNAELRAAYEALINAASP